MVTLLFLLATLAAQAGPAPRFEAAQPLTTWKTAMAGASISAQGSTFEMAGGTGWTRTTNVYLDYRFSVDFQLASSDAEGAVYVRAGQDRRNSLPNVGYRVAIRTNGTTPDWAGRITAQSSRLSVITPGSQRTPLDQQWHSMDVDVVGDRVTVRVDGTLVSEAEGAELGAGHIGLEHRTGLLRFRNPTIALLRERTWEATRGTAGGTPESPGIMSGTAGVVRPTLLSDPKPRYSADTLLARVQGTVYLDVVIDETGRVAQTVVTRSVDPDLDLEARAAARRWRFRPATQNGRPVAFRATFALDFTPR